MLANIFGVDVGIVAAVAVVVLVAGRRLPRIARNLGSASREFRRAQKDLTTPEPGATRAASPPGAELEAD